MSSARKRSFKRAASAEKRPAPFSIRLSDQERAYLERKAGRRPLGKYIRVKLLGDQEAPRKTTRATTIDYAMLGQVLGMLGKSEQISCLFHLLAAAEADRLALDDAEKKALFDACEEVRDMRALLITALGLKVSANP